MSEKIESVEALIARVEAAHPNTSRTALAVYFEAVHQELAPLARSLERRVAELENELAESAAERARMGNLLNKTVKALLGRQMGDTSPYDWSDAPTRAEAAIAGLGAATHSFYVEHERAEMMAEIVRGVVDVVTTDFESKETFVARVRAILGDDPSLRVSEIRKEHDALKAELEIERIRLDACGVVAIADTPESAATVRDMREEYWSASCDDVARRVDECIALRTERDSLRLVCGEAYQMAGALGASAKALDNLSAAANGQPLPHETFLPALSEESDIEKERDALAAELKLLRARAIELEAETKSSEEMQTLKFCEREWSTERAAMMNTINALRNCGDAHPIPVRELTDEDIQRLWDKHGLDDYCDANGFARAIEAALMGESDV